MAEDNNLPSDYGALRNPGATPEEGAVSERPTGRQGWFDCGNNYFGVDGVELRDDKDWLLFYEVRRSDKEIELKIIQNGQEQKLK